MSTPLGNGDDAQLMAEYEFKMPITATLIFCDSDEGSTLSSETKPNNGNTNYTNNTTNNSLEGTYEAKNKSKHETGVKNKEKYTKQLEVSENESQALFTTIREQPLQKNSTEQGFQYQAALMDSRGDLSTNAKNIATTTLQGCIERHPLGSITPIQEDITSSKVNECLQTLLNVVSNHMVFIMKAYLDYRIYTRTTSDKTVLESAKKNLQQIKHKFFYMSFSAVANILLPKENDKVFMQNFIESTVKISESKHLYVKHSDMSLLCEEMFGWVKTYNQHPYLAGLLSKEPQEHSAIITNSCQEQPSGYKANNALDNPYCIFRSGPTNRELTITVNSADVHNSLNVQNVPLGQGTQPVSNELRNNANAMNYLDHYPVHHNMLSRQSVPPPNYSSHYPVSNVTYRQVSQPASNELGTNGYTNYTSHYPVLNAPSIQRVLPSIDEWRTNTNANNYTSQGPIQNMTLSQEPQPTREELSFNANSTNCTSHQKHVQNVPSRQGVQPHMNKWRTNANPNNYVHHDPAQNSPSRHTVLTPRKAKLNKDAQSKNYIQEFEKFNSSKTIRPSSLKECKSTRRQSNNVRVQQQETHPHPTYTPTSVLPPYYSPHIRHQDAVTTPQDNVQKQIANSNHCDNFQDGQEDVNRSLSRDSGFMSPLTWVPQDPMAKSPRYYEQVDSTSVLVTPMITHVTSLNPSVAYIKDGICHMCGKLTKDKCLGCFKLYYCSHQCQIDDWKNHIFICK